MGFLLHLRSGSPFFLTPGDSLGVDCPHIHVELMPSSMQCYCKVSSSPSVWSCGVSIPQTPRMIREAPPALGDPLLTQHCGGAPQRCKPGGFELANVVISRLQQYNVAWLRLAKKQQFINLFTEGRWGTFP